MPNGSTAGPGSTAASQSCRSAISSSRWVDTTYEVNRLQDPARFRAAGVRELSPVGADLAHHGGSLFLQRPLDARKRGDGVVHVLPAPEASEKSSRAGPVELCGGVRPEAVLILLWIIRDSASPGREFSDLVVPSNVLHATRQLLSRTSHEPRLREPAGSTLLEIQPSVGRPRSRGPSRDEWDDRRSCDRDRRAG